MRLPIPFVVLALSALTLTAACDRPVEPDYLSCADVSTTPLAADEASAFGYSPGEIIPAVQGDHAADLTFAKGAVTTVTVSVGSMGDSQFVERQVEDPETGELYGEESFWCASAVQIDAVTSITSADGSFAETLQGPFEVDAEGIARLSARRAPEAVQGTFDFAAFDATEYKTVELVFEVEIGPDGMSGKIWADTYRETPDANTWSMIDVAVF